MGQYRTRFTPHKGQTIPDMTTIHEPDSDDMFDWLTGHGIPVQETSVETTPRYEADGEWHPVTVEQENRL